MKEKFKKHKWVFDITSGPGGGKDTLASNLLNLLTYCYPKLKDKIQIIGMSDCLRSQIELQKQSKIAEDKVEALKVEQTMKDGGSVEFKFIEKAFGNHLVNALSKNRIVILTGVSRNIKQAKMVDRIIKNVDKDDNIKLNKITHIRMFIEVPEKILKQRLYSRGRDDDKNSHAIIERLKIWNDNGPEVLKYWKDNFSDKVQVIRTLKNFKDKPKQSKIDYLEQLRPILEAYNLGIKRENFTKFTKLFIDE